MREYCQGSIKRRIRIGIAISVTKPEKIQKKGICFLQLMKDRIRWERREKFCPHVNDLYFNEILFISIIMLHHLCPSPFHSGKYIWPLDIFVHCKYRNLFSVSARAHVRSINSPNTGYLNN